MEKILHALLVADTDVTSKTSAYALAAGGATMPAIFTLEGLPDDTPYPAVRISQVSGSGEFGCRAHKGGETSLDVRILGDKSTSNAVLRALADAVWEAVHRADLRVLLAAEGMEDWGCLADPPMYMEDEDGFPGYNVQARIKTLKA